MSAICFSCCHLLVPNLEQLYYRLILVTKLNNLDLELLIRSMSAASFAILILSLLLGLMTFLFIFRIVLTWYPQVDLNRLPFNLITLPTEPFLVPVRKIVPPFGGVDITPIIWVAILTLLREILLGQQGLLTMALQSH